MVIKRIAIPNSLKKNASTWEKELLNEIKLKGNYSAVEDKFKNKYRQEDVKDALEKMYFGKCCYCERGIGAGSYEHIEHLRPKSNPLFHNLCYTWDNLHWACMKCNMNKGAKWEINTPILDPTKDEFSDYFTIDRVTGEIKAIKANRRALVTIEHTKLNREKLIKARKRIINQLNIMALKVKKTPSEKDDEEMVKLLETFIEEDADFASLLKQYVNEILK